MFSFTTWERMMLLQIASAVEGNAATTRNAFKLIEKLEMREEESQAVGMKQTSTGAFTWDDKTREWAMEFDKNSEALLKNVVQGFQHWNAAQTPLRVALFAKLGIEEPPETPAPV